MVVAAPAYAQSKLEVGGFATYSFLKEIGTRDVGVGTDIAGLGGRLVYQSL